jgi:hypothetical protein
MEGPRYFVLRASFLFVFFRVHSWLKNVCFRVFCVLFPRRPGGTRAVTLAPSAPGPCLRHGHLRAAALRPWNFQVSGFKFQVSLYR